MRMLAGILGRPWWRTMPTKRDQQTAKSTARYDGTTSSAASPSSGDDGRG